MRDFAYFFYKKGAQNQTVNEDSFQSLYPSEYFVGLSVEDHSLDMECFLKKALPQLIAQNLLTISIDDKCIGEKLSDLEKNCHGTLIQIPDPRSGKRVSYLIGFTPTDSKNDETLAELTRFDHKKNLFLLFLIETICENMVSTLMISFESYLVYYLYIILRRLHYFAESEWH